MKVRILAVGRLKAGPERELAARYLDRARAAGRSLGLAGFDVAELVESREGDAARRREAEAAALLARVGTGAARIALDESGEMPDSRRFASLIAELRDAGEAEAAFLVGGPDGHGDAALSGARLVLSLGRLTWPHQLVRIMLAEQLYRAVTLVAGHPYHRD